MDKLTIVIFVLLVLIACNSSTKPAMQKSGQQISAIPFDHYHLDTLRYIKENFTDKHYLFEGQPLSLFLNAFKLKLNRFLVIPYGLQDNACSGICLLFYDDVGLRYKKRKNENPMILTFGFEKALSLDSAFNLMVKDHGKWTKEEISFFGKHVVKEFGIGNSNANTKKIKSCCPGKK